MAARTPSTTVLDQFGSCKIYIFTFTDIDDGDTYASSISGGIIGYWANGTDNPTQTKEKIDVSLSSTTFTFNTGEDNRAVMLYVLAKNKNG